MKGQDFMVVGVDGSPESDAAVAWAANEAVRADVLLRIVHVARSPSFLTDPVLATPVRQGIFVDAAAALAVQANSAVRCEMLTQTGLPSITFLQMSEGASLIVLGGHHRNLLDRLVFGSVTTHVLAQASCPVVVVRGHAEQGSPVTPGPVVVGVDHDGTSDDALEFAFEYANAHDLELVAVQAWTAQELSTSDDRPTTIRVVQDALTAALRPTHAKYPRVSVVTVAACETPVDALLDWSEKGSLLVVGSRGRGHFASMLLGSVSSAVAHQAPCSVAVVRPRVVSELPGALAS